MASLTSPRRPDAAERRTVRLEASEAVRDQERTEVEPVSWPVAAVVGGLATAAVGWVVVAGLVVCGWLMGDDAGLRGALELGTRIWLLAGGVPVRIGTLDVSLVPWGVTALTTVMLWRFGGYAGRRVASSSSAGPFAVGVVVTVAYALPVLATAVFLGEPWRAPGRWAAVLAVLLVAAWAGAGARMGRPVGSSWPTSVSGLPRAVVGALGVLLLAGAAVLVLGLVTGWDRVVGLNAALRPGSLGTVLLVVVQAAVLPNALVWSGSYALGAGFSLGSGSVVAPAATSVGVLPGLPLLGALPAVGPGSTLQLWWLAAGAVAGALAATLALRPGTARRTDACTLVGGLSGVAAGLVFTGLAWTTSGDLGTLRLTGLGPRLLPLLVMSTTTLGLSGMLTGTVVGVVRYLHRTAAEDERDDTDGSAHDRTDDEPTEVVERTEVLGQTEEVEGALGRVAAVPDPAPLDPGNGSRSPARLVVLLSGTGTLLQALLDAAADPTYGARVVAVGSDRPDVLGLERAAAAGIETFVHPLVDRSDRAGWDAALADRVAAHDPDLVISAGFMKLLGPDFLARFGGRTINTHPALLPAFPGMHGPRDALAYGVKVTGATVFLVDAGVDTGVVLDQAVVEVQDDDTVDSLHERIKVAERDLLVSTTHALVTRPWRVVGRKVLWAHDSTDD